MVKGFLHESLDTCMEEGMRAGLALKKSHPGFPCAVIKFFLGLHLRLFTNVKWSKKICRAFVASS